MQNVCSLNRSLKVKMYVIKKIHLSVRIDVFLLVGIYLAPVD